MDFAIQISAYLIGIPLQILTIHAMLRKSYAEFPFVFAYVIGAFLAAVIEAPLSLAYYRNADDKSVAYIYAMWYWIDEAVLEVLVFAVVLSLVYYATSKLPSRRLIRTALLIAAVLFVGITFQITYRVGVIHQGLWLTPWFRDVKFGAAVLDLALWAMLLASREKDQRILFLSCGLGIMFAGQAIGESIRSLAIGHELHVVSIIGGLVGLAAESTMMYLWWRVFRAQEPAATKIRPVRSV
jgi:hypothetical protein